MRKWKYNSTILDPGTRWIWMVSFSPRQHHPWGRSRRNQLDKMLSCPQGRSGRCGEESLGPTGNRTSPYQPAARRSIDWAITVPNSLRVPAIPPLFLLAVSFLPQAGHGSSLGSRDRGFESQTMHGCLVCVCVVLCLGSCLATSWLLVQGVILSVKWSK
jgi:hypothetical protein